MKRALSFLLVAVILVSLLPSAMAKGQTDAEIAFNTSNEAYNNINAAYTIIEDLSGKISEAWRMGIYEQKKDDFGLKYLANELDVPLDDMKLGVACLWNNSDWDNYTEEEKQEKASSSEVTFILMQVLFSDDIFSLCVQTVISTYEATGKIDEAEEFLTEAKSQMRSLSQKYSDYEHYPALKGFYTTTTAFLDYCKSPVGSFQQMKDTINDYRNTARKYKNDVAFIFED